MNAGLTSPSISPRTFTSSGHLRFREQRKNIFPGEADLVKVTTSLTNAQDIPAYGVFAIGYRWSEGHAFFRLEIS